MSKKYTIEEVIDFVNNNSKSKLQSKEYHTNKDKLEFLCECGEIFLATFDKFKNRNKRQCTKCGRKEFILEQTFSYDYVKKFIETYSCKLITENYINQNQKLEITCKCGDVFITTFDSFKYKEKHQCNKCSFKNSSKIQRKEYLIVRDELNSMGIKLLTPEEEYINSKTNMIGINKDGYKIFFTYGGIKQDKKPLVFSPSNPFSLENIKFWLDKNKKEFVLFSEKYVKNYQKFKFKCNKCGDTWDSILHNILKGSECPRCKSSKGESKIDDYLVNNHIKLKKQYSFNDLKGKKYKLRFDFGILNNDGVLLFLVEYDGEFHYKWMQDLVSKSSFERQQLHDKLKDEYCKNNNIPLLRIPYWEFGNIENIVKYELSKYISN